MQRSAESSSGNDRSAQRRSSTPSSETSIQSWIVHTQYRLIPAAAGPTRSGRSRVRARAIAAYEASLTVGHHAAYAESRASSSRRRYRSSDPLPVPVRGSRSPPAAASAPRGMRSRAGPGRPPPPLLARPGRRGVGPLASQCRASSAVSSSSVRSARSRRVGLEGVGDLRVQAGPRARWDGEDHRLVGQGVGERVPVRALVEHEAGRAGRLEVGLDLARPRAARCRRRPRRGTSGRPPRPPAATPAWPPGARRAGAPRRHGRSPARRAPRARGGRARRGRTGYRRSGRATSARRRGRRRSATPLDEGDRLGAVEPVQLDAGGRAGGRTPRRRPRGRRSARGGDGGSPTMARGRSSGATASKVPSARRVASSAQCRSSRTTRTGRRRAAPRTARAIRSQVWNASWPGPSDPASAEMTSASDTSAVSSASASRARRTSSQGHSGGAPSSCEQAPAATHTPCARASSER